MNAVDHIHRGDSFRDQGRFAEAVAEYQIALQLRPRDAGLWNNLGIALKSGTQSDDAVMAFLKAIEFKPNFVQAFYNLGNALIERGDITRAIAIYRKAITIDPTSSRIHGALLYTLHFAEGMTKAQLIAEHRQWAARHADPLKSNQQPHSNSRDPNRKLRIGYFSPNFVMHPISRFILPLFAQHDRKQFEIFAYSTIGNPDTMTEELKSHTDTWRDIGAATDEQAANIIGTDGIDILIDLSMHMGYRLPIFACKPAPVQISYLAYASTTGLDAIDYRITDPYLEPPADQSGEHFCEKQLQVPSYWCYLPSEPEIDLAPPPSVKNGFITFGCLNNFRKISPSVRKIWANLLVDLPDAHLMIHAHEGSHREELFNFLYNEGIESERIHFIGLLPLADYLRQYQQIDIALDTFPYAGGTTTCDALWMGVPVITLQGDLPISRSGVSILSQTGLQEFIAQSPGEYVGIAKKLARDPRRLAHLHATIRDQMKASPLMDAQRFAATMEDAYRKAWQTWCSSAANLNSPSL